MAKSKGIKAVNYFKWLYQMKKNSSPVEVATNVAAHKGETLPLGKGATFYIHYCLSHAPAIKRGKRPKKRKSKQPKKNQSALGFANIPRQPGEWIDQEQYDNFYKSREWRELRYLALKNTDGRCECCGASAKDGVRLHVDHIKPRSARPDLRLSLSNVQVLCVDCNLGKGVWDETDWRNDAANHMDDIIKH